MSWLPLSRTRLSMFFILFLFWDGIGGLWLWTTSFKPDVVCDPHDFPLKCGHTLSGLSSRLRTVSNNFLMRSNKRLYRVLRRKRSVLWSKALRTLSQALSDSSSWSRARSWENKGHWLPGDEVREGPSPLLCWLVSLKPHERLHKFYWLSEKPISMLLDQWTFTPSRNTKLQQIMNIRPHPCQHQIGSGRNEPVPRYVHITMLKELMFKSRSVIFCNMIYLLESGNRSGRLWP